MEKKPTKSHFIILKNQSLIKYSRNIYFLHFSTWVQHKIWLQVLHGSINRYMLKFQLEIYSRHLHVLEIRQKEKFCLQKICHSNKDMKYYTGFSSYKLFTYFYELLNPACQLLSYVGTENRSKNKEYEFFRKPGPPHSLTAKEELFITLVRLRKGIPEKMLGDLYCLSEGHISKIINTWILFLENRLRLLPIWPSKDEIRKSMPECFQKFKDTRIIIDCTEIFIEQPSASTCQRETFSNYKHHNTAKGLIGIAPSGQLTFISRLYAGRCSDKKILWHCGLLDLEKGDGVMVDKGFDCEKELQLNEAHIIIPPFLKQQDQFTPEQVKNTRTIASVSIHIERAVRRIKELKFCEIQYQYLFVRC